MLIPRRHRFLAFAAIAAAIGITGCQQDTTPVDTSADEAAVIECFNSYKEAVLARDGKRAAELVDQSTIDDYNDYRQLAYRASRHETRQLPIITKLMVLRLRHDVPRELLDKSDGKGLIVYAVDQGWVGSESVSKQSVNNVRVNGDTALAKAWTNGQPTPLDWQFHREQKAWRLNINSNMDVIDEAFGKLASDSGMTDDDFLLTLMGSLSATAPSDDVWNPIESPK